MSTFYVIAGELFLGDEQVYGVGMFADLIGNCRQKAPKTRQKRAISARKPAPAPRMEVGDYLAACPGVSPWIVGQIVRRFRLHAVRLDLIGTAFLMESENPGVPPVRLWNRIVKRWRKQYKHTLGMTGRSGSSGSNFAAVDSSFDLTQIVAAVCDEAKWELELEQARIAAFVAKLLDSAQQGLGSALVSGKTMAEACVIAGCSLATGYRSIDSVRELLTA